MVRKLTREIKYVRLPENRIGEIQELVAAWPYETKAFMRARLNQYKPRGDLLNTVLDTLLSLFMSAPEKQFKILKNPDILTDWQKRFELSGETNPQDAWNKILEKEVSARDYQYLLELLDKELTDVHVPWELADLFTKIYRAHLRKEYLSDATIPKSPLLLITGPTGSGKTATIKHTIRKIIFAREILPEIDFKQKKEELLSNEPFWKTIQEVDPTLTTEIERRRRLIFYKRLGRLPLIRFLFKRQIGQNLGELEEQGLLVDYTMITPNDYQTALAGEPGNYFKKAMGDPRKTAIRHIEEAHSAFGKIESRESSGVERQQRTLIDTSNIILDEIISGHRDCLLIATSDQPERFDGAIYRRFVEKGKIIDISDYWKNHDNLREIVRIELLHSDIRTDLDPRSARCKGARCIPPGDLVSAVEKLYIIFKERSLKITPSYVRKLIHSIIEIKNDFTHTYLDDPFLVRSAFELVAKNTYGDLYKKLVNRMDRHVRWEEYVGEIKNTYSEMCNNCLFYGISEEKGVVLNGPPGSGKTFLARAWLSENGNVHDIAASPTSLQDPINLIEGTVENLEKIYEIAKMIAPTVVFFDEGDSIAPKRSASGGAPSDKLTNKFLSLIDGEVPLNKVFTTLTTNRIDILDPALIRSKRLKVLEISGHMNQDNIVEIIKQNLKGIPLAPGCQPGAIIEAAQGLCNTPADYTAFVEKARSLRSTEYAVLLKFRGLKAAKRDASKNFIKFNFKTLTGILDAVSIPSELRSDIKNNPSNFINHYDTIIKLMENISSLDAYPLMPSHLFSARNEISNSPIQKGKIQLDEFLEAELSQEPQVGFIIGAGANDVAGVLLPIATSLTYSLSPEKVLVTGAVSSATSAAAEMDMAVQMTQQSAQEALTLVKNYLQDLYPKVSIPRLLGEFLEKYTIHHQLLSASYNVGGPSAGYALALNTISSLLQIPVYNDFGITGAPWTKGVKKGEVGGSVIIGGHKKKAEKVLLHLRRMFMPLQNYKDLEHDFLINYWTQGKDILGVTHFGDLIPEVLWLDAPSDDMVNRLIDMRIQYKMSKYQDNKASLKLQEEILEIKTQLKAKIEKVIIDRLKAIRKYLRSPVRDPHLSLDEIIHADNGPQPNILLSIQNFLKNTRSGMGRKKE